MEFLEFDQAVYEMLGLRTLIINRHKVYKSEFSKLIGKKVNNESLKDQMIFGHYVFKRVVHDDALHIYIGPYSDRMGDAKLNALIKILNFNSREMIDVIRDNEMMTDSDDTAEYRQDLKMLFRLEKSILLNFKNESYDRVQSDVRMILNYTIDESRNTLRHWKSYFKTFNNILVQVSQKLKVSEEDIGPISESHLERANHIYELNTLKKLFMTLLRAYYDLNVSSQKIDVNPMIEAAIHYIRENHSKKISTSIVSHAIGVNASHLSRQFKKEMGTTITFYIQTYRVDEAKLLIEQGNLSITTIASLLGFSDVQYFTTTFKKIMNMTPTEYGKQL